MPGQVRPIIRELDGEHETKSEDPAECGRQGDQQRPPDQEPSFEGESP